MDFIPPMLAVAGNPFDSEDYLFEIKWDGIRAIALVTEQSTTLFSRNANDISFRYPELQLSPLAREHPLILDGEIIVLKEGKPSFHTLQTRDHLQDPKKIRAAAQSIPAIFVAFDLLALGGKDLTGLPLLRRKELLAQAVREGGHLVISQYITGGGKAMFDMACRQGLEGVMAKRLDSAYLSGRRSPMWIKFRNVKSLSCVICGYVSGVGGRTRLGSLILGLYSGDNLVYVGNAGSGLGEREIDYLLQHLKRTPSCPFNSPPALKGAVWVEPEMVCEVKYLEMGQTLRHPTFIGLRSDLSPRQCVFKQE